MPKAPYQLFLPKERSTSVVFSSPHSGRHYGWGFQRKSLLDELAIRSSEDAYVDRLFETAPTMGAPLLTALTPRAFVDLNRSAEELDPALVEGVKKGSHNPRIASGLGVIPRVVSNGRAIYRGKIPLSEAQHRISYHWRPYHDTLQGLLNESLGTFGEAILVDCHSMPHEALENLTASGVPRADVVLGDRFGAAAHSEIVEEIEAAFSAAGLTVSRNAPFAGAYITQHYGRPSKRQHVVQVEIDRSLYMDEALVRPSKDFHAFRRLIKGVIGEIVKIGHRRISLAAE